MIVFDCCGQRKKRRKERNGSYQFGEGDCDETTSICYDCQQSVLEQLGSRPPVLLVRGATLKSSIEINKREENCLYHLIDTRNSRVQGHGIRIVLYAHVGLVTVDSIEVNCVVYIYETGASP